MELFGRAGFRARAQGRRLLRRRGRIEALILDGCPRRGRIRVKARRAVRSLGASGRVTEHTRPLQRGDARDFAAAPRISDDIKGDAT